MVYYTALYIQMTTIYYFFLSAKIKVSFVSNKMIISYQFNFISCCACGRTASDYQARSGAFWAFSGLGSACTAQSWEWQGHLCPQDQT